MHTRTVVFVRVRMLEQTIAEWLRGKLLNSTILARPKLARQSWECNSHWGDLLGAEHPRGADRAPGCRLAFGIQAQGPDIGAPSYVAAPRRLALRDLRRCSHGPTAHPVGHPTIACQGTNGPRNDFFALLEAVLEILPLPKAFSGIALAGCVRPQAETSRHSVTVYLHTAARYL